MNVEPYLSFEGRCEEAIEFYKKAVGAKVEMLMRFGEAPESCPGMPPAEKVMHSSLRIGNSVVMATDGQCTGKSGFSGISLSLSAANDAETAKMFNALLEDGGNACMPLAKTFFASQFGIATDKFGVTWMVITAQ